MAKQRKEHVRRIGTRGPRAWAKRLLELMGPEEFTRFAEFADGGDMVEFSGACAALDAKHYPAKYSDP